MTRPSPTDQKTAQTARKAALIMGGTMVGWMLVQVVGRDMGWPPALALAFDLLALGGFATGLTMTYRLWRARRT